MKKLYLMAVMVGMGLSAAAQNTEVHEVNPRPVAPESGVAVGFDHSATSTDRMKGDIAIYYHETFSNGLAGENGEWTTDGATGDLWFQTFPLGTPNGYDPDTINNSAYSALPGFFGTQTTVASETADNGFMMLDADAYNSERFTAEDDPALTYNPVEAFLVSPGIDLTGVTGAAIAFTQKYRVCCTAMALYADISFDGGANWTQAWADEGFDHSDVFESTIIQNFTHLMNAAGDLSEVKIRFRWPHNAPNTEGYTNSHYYWMIDDVKIIEAPLNDLIVEDVGYNNWLELQHGWDNGTVSDLEYVKAFENSVTPNFLAQPLNFVVVVTNGGAQAQTGVGITATVTMPDGTEEVFTTEAADLITLEAGASDTLTLMNRIFTSGYFPYGDYSVEIGVFQNEVDYYPADNSMTKTFAIHHELYCNANEATHSPIPTDDYILGQRYYFPDNPGGLQRLILGVDFVLFNTGEEGFNTSEEVLLFANIRKGSIFENDATTVEFGDDPLTYEPIETAYLTSADDFYTGGDLVWSTIYFMSVFGEPIAVPVDGNNIYQAEIRVPKLDPGTEVSMALQDSQEAGATIIEGLETDGATWGYFGQFAALIRFKTLWGINVKNVSFAHGIQLFQNYPNPFDVRSKVNFKLPRASEVSVEIHDMQGRLIRSEDLGTLPQGVSEYYVDGQGMSPGIYTYTLVTEMGRVTRKMSVCP